MCPQQSLPPGSPACKPVCSCAVKAPRFSLPFPATGAKQAALTNLPCGTDWGETNSVSQGHCGFLRQSLQCRSGRRLWLVWGTSVPGNFKHVVVPHVPVRTMNSKLHQTEPPTSAPHRTGGLALPAGLRAWRVEDLCLKKSTFLRSSFQASWKAAASHLLEL